MKKRRQLVYLTPGITVKTDNSFLPAFEFCGSQKLTAIIGISAGRPIALNLASAPHVIIAGTTGSGKSVCIKTIINNLLIKNSPARLRLSFCDPKIIDYDLYRGLPHCNYYGDNVNAITQVLSNERAIMFNRYREMKKTGITDISVLGFPARVIVFDELPALLDGPAKKAIMPLLKDLLRLGRAAGVHVIIGSQVANSTIIDTQVKANCPVRIAFRVTSAIQSRVILESSGAEKLPGRGAGILFDQYGNKSNFSGLMASDSQESAIINYWQSKNCIA